MFDAYLPISRLGCGIFVLKRFDDLSYICIGFIYKLIEVTVYEFRAVALSDVWNVSSIKCGSRTNNICIIRKNIYNYGPKQPIKCKLLLSIYSQLCLVEYGVFGRWSHVGVKICLTINSPNTVDTFCLGRLGELRSGYSGLKGLTQTKSQFVLKKVLSDDCPCWDPPMEGGNF